MSNIYIVTNVHFVGEPIVDKVYSKLSTEQTLLVNGKTVWLGEDSKRVIMPKGVSYSQAEELAESLMNLDLIHSYQIIQEWATNTQHTKSLNSSERNWTLSHPMVMSGKRKTSWTSWSGLTSTRGMSSKMTERRMPSEQSHNRVLRPLWRAAQRTRPQGLSRSPLECRLCQ